MLGLCSPTPAKGAATVRRLRSELREKRVELLEKIQE